MKLKTGLNYRLDKQSVPVGRYPTLAWQHPESDIPAQVGPVAGGGQAVIWLLHLLDPDHGRVQHTMVLTKEPKIDVKHLVISYVVNHPGMSDILAWELEKADVPRDAQMVPVSEYAQEVYKRDYSWIEVEL